METHSSPQPQSPERQDPREAGLKPPFLKEEEQQAPGSEAKMRNKPDFGEESYKGLGRLEGKKALITGADSGIGRAVALAFAREGADVAVSYLSEHEDAAETKRVVESAGRRCLLLPGDISDEAHCQTLVEQAARELGQIDLLVNNAAEQGKSVDAFEEIDGERVLQTFKTNIVAMFYLTRAALPHMKPGSAIINVGSIQAYQPTPGILDYACTKGAIVTFSKGLAQELIKRGIRVNCVAPGPVWTPLITQSFNEEKIQSFASEQMGRPAQPVELAPLFVFLASNESRFVNGEVLGGTGGALLA